MDATERVPPLCVVAPRWRTGRLRRQDATERVPCDRVVVEVPGRHLFPTILLCPAKPDSVCSVVKKRTTAWWNCNRPRPSVRSGTRFGIVRPGGLW